MDVLPAWGVDLTSVAVRAVKLELGDSGRPRIVAWDLVDYTEEVEDISALSRFHQMARGLYHFSSRHDLKACRVFVSLRGETAFNRTVVIPPVTDESLDKLLEYEAQQQIPFPLEDVFWDRRVLSIREDGEIMATIYAVRKQVVEDRLRKLAKESFPTDGLQIRPIALHNFCAVERLLEPGTIVVDVDYGSLQVLVYHDEQSWFRCLPVGGVDFIKRLRETFHVDHRRAVRMASGEARIADRDKFLRCREEVAHEIANDAARVVRYYLAARPEVKPSGLVLFESHRCVPPLGAALKELLGLPAYKPKGFRAVEVDPEVVTAGIQEHFHGLARAAGLALQGVGKGEIDARLYPAELQRPLVSGRIGYVLAGVLLVLLVAWVGYKRKAEADHLQERLLTLQETLAEGAPRAAIRRSIDFEGDRESFLEMSVPAVGRAGPLPVVEAVYRVVAEHAAEPRPPRLVALAAGEGSGAPPGRARLTLAVEQGGDPGGAEALLAKVVGELEATDAVDGAVAGRSWIAGAIVTEPPPGGPQARLRWRLLHREYTLRLGEGL